MQIRHKLVRYRETHTSDAGTGNHDSRMSYGRSLHHTHLPGSATHHNLTVAYIA
jgi:hypothetical protein